MVAAMAVVAIDGISGFIVLDFGIVVVDTVVVAVSNQSV